MLEQQVNPLLPSVLQLLRAAPAGISEYELLKLLAWDGIDLSTHTDDAELILFRKHFVLMNALYQLQEILWREEYLWLTITPLRIAIEPTAELASSCALSAADSTALRDYYLDWQQLSETGSEDVAALLNSFWRSFTALDTRADALLALQLESDASWSQIQRQYRRLAAVTHPDRGGDGAQFLLIREAYETLRMIMPQQQKR